jgi:hypothetical protein
MKKIVVLLTVVLVISFFTGAAKSELIDRGSGLIYDDILDITWLEYANYSGETMTWDEAMSWADNFAFQGYDDWRLPASDTSCTGNGCTGSEMGQLYYNYNVTSGSADMFTDVRPYMYWSATVYGPDTSMAWRFHFGTGYQGTSSKTYARYVWAVRDGDSALPVVPEPTGFVLFILGGISLAAKRFRKRLGE